MNRSTDTVPATLSTRTWLSVFGVVFTVMMTSGGMLWRLAQVVEKVEKNHQEIMSLENKALPNLRKDVEANKAFAIRATEKLESIGDKQDKMDVKLDRLLEKF